MKATEQPRKGQPGHIPEARERVSPTPKQRRRLFREPKSNRSRSVILPRGVR